MEPKSFGRESRGHNDRTKRENYILRHCSNWSLGGIPTPSWRRIWTWRRTWYRVKSHREGTGKIPTNPSSSNRNRGRGRRGPRNSRTEKRETIQDTDQGHHFTNGNALLRNTYVSVKRAWQTVPLSPAMPVTTLCSSLISATL